MAYQALYRKWRPKVFEDVVGQQHIIETIKNQISAGKIAHAYLFCGSRGTGKTSTAKILSRAVNCENPVNGNPCNECKSCRGILNGSIFDVTEIDGASNNKVDDVRNLRDEILYPPADVKYKVFIIDEVHMFTTEAFNALLKTLEEPPSYVIFVLATTEFHKLPATIISRCQKFDFRRITFKDTARRISEVAFNDGVEITPSAINLIAKAADGSLRDGLSKLDQCMALGLSKIDFKDVAGIIGASDPEYLSELCDLIIDKKLAEALKKLDEGINLGIDPMRLYSDITDYFRDLMMYKVTSDSELLTNSEEEIIEKYVSQSQRITLSGILKITEALSEGLNSAKYTASPKLSFEITLLKIASPVTSNDVSAFAERLEKVEAELKNLKSRSAVVRMPANNEEVTDVYEYEEEIGFGDDDYPYEEMTEGAVSYEPDNATYDGGEISVEENGRDSGSLLATINENLKDILSLAKNADIGFSGIIRKAEITESEGKIILWFSESISYDIATKFGYKTVFGQALSEFFSKEIPVEVRDKKAKAFAGNEEISSKDPFDDIMGLANNNSGLFNLE